MAGGNLGDLWFQLGVKDNTSKELQKIIDKLKTGDDAANALLRALQGFGTKKSGFKEQAEKAKEFADVLNEINRRISKLKKNDKSDEAKDLQLAVKNALSYLDMLQRINIERSKISELRSLNPNVDTSKLREAELMLENINNQLFRLQNKAQGGGGGGVDSAKVLQDYVKVLQMTFRDVKQITDQFKKENPLSAFSGGAAKVEADIARVTEKLARMRDLMAEGSLKGYNTNMLGRSITELDKILARLQAASGNKSILTDAAQMKNLLSDVAVEMTKAAAATQAYGREKGKVIAQEREFAAASKLSAKENDAELKALSDYAKRYLALQEAKRKAEKQASDERKRQSAAEARRIEADTERMSRLYAKMSLVIGRGERAGMRGLELGVNTSALEKALSEATELKRRIEDANIALMGKGGRPSYSSYAEEVNRLSSSLANATQAQRDLNSAQDKANRKAEAQYVRDAAKAKREEVAAEKQRQNELKNTERRYDSLGNKVRQLRSEYSRGISIGADVSKAEAEISRLLSLMRALINIKERLNSENWKDSLGLLGNIGSGHDTTLASRVLQDQKAVNREVQRGIELEQKRQQEIAQTAAKVQSDLVRGFERANSHAGKLNSTVQDLKSLFLQGGLVFGAQQFAMSIITTGGEMEKQHIALQSILGDMQNANTMFNQIKELALNSPFTFSELNRDVKQLAAYGVEYDQLYDTTKRLADMSSGLGVSFDRIALAFGQVQARGWLDGKELRQIAYAGIPLLDKLSKFYSKQEGRNVSTSEIKTRISNREVSFDDVKSIFWQMTDAGGQFYNMQQTLSETLLGRYNKLKDAWEIILADFADGKSVIGGTFKFILDQVTNLVQLMHTLSPVVIGAVSGFAMKRVGTLLAGSAASNFLTNKEKIAQDIKARALSGQQLSVVEQRILATKKQITKEDLQTLITAKAITKTELQRLYLSGKISKEMYKQAMAQAGMNTFWTNFANRGGVAISLLGKSLGSMVSSLWAMIGGLPGLILTAVTMGIGYAVSKYQELSRAIEQSQSELDDRLKQIRDFRMDNSNGMAKALADGDTKEIDNLIESYKEKLKELAPYNFNNLVMKADEKKSHEERLKYLDLELQKLQEAEKLAKSKLNVRSNYGDLKDAIDYANIFYDDKDKLTYKYISDGIDKNIARQKAFSVDKYAEFNANRIKDRIQEIFGDISKDDTLRLAAEQAMSSVFSTLGIPEDRANEIRASVLQAFGIGNKDSWLQGEVRTKMQALIDETFPEIGAKIRASIPLTQAEQDKVKELMNDAKQGLVRQYPELEKTLQGMLANSNFQAVIKLVFATDDKFNNMTSELIGRIPDNLNGLATQDIAAKYRSFAKKWGKDDSWYGGRNAAKSDIDAAYNEYQSALKSKSKDVNSKRDAWILVRDAAKALLYYDYTGEGKKSNKPGKKNKGGHQEDEQLKRLQERLSSLKSARQMYQKYKSIMSDEEAKKKTYNLFPEVTGLNLDDYQKAVHSLLDGFKINTTERKKFQTSIYREVAEWLFDEKDKKEYEKKAADFSESMNKLSERWDLYKSLLEKTGSKFFAESAWVDAFQMDDKVQSLMDEYYAHYHEIFNLQDSLSMTDGEAKEKLKLPNQYDEWKKITELLRSNYVQSLQDGADAMQQTMSVAQKLDSITEKYNKKRKYAGANKDLIARYDFLEKEEKSGVLFDQMKSEVNWDGVFGDLGNYTKKELKKVRKDINNLISGGLLNGMSTTDIKSVYEGLGKLNMTIDGEGFSGLSDLLTDLIDASEKYDDAVKEYNESVKKYGKDGWQTDQARKVMLQAEQRRRTAQGNVNTKKGTILGNVVTLANMFKTLGASNGSGSALLQNAGGWTEAIMKMFGASEKNSSKIGGAIGMFAGLTEVIAEKGFGGFLSDAFEDIGGAVNSIFKDMLGINLGISGADYSDYNKAKAEYENLTSIWDSLISKKTEYMNIHWGTEATEASKEAQEMLKAEIEQTKVIAQKRLNAGASAGSHSIKYRMWKGSYKYNGQNWRDVAGEISSKYGVQFNGMEDMLNMNADTLSKIKKDYTGLWANMDSEFRDYLEKLIQYGEKADDMVEAITEKLTGNKFSDLVSSWGDAMATMANSSDNLVEHFEDNLKKTILNSMIENIYGDKIKALLKKTQEYAENGDKIKDSNGNVISEYTGAEYTDVKNTTDELSKQIEATRDYLKKEYGWSDNSSSSSRNSVKSITEETGDLIASYLNSIRLYCAEDNTNLKQLTELTKSALPEMSVIAKSQLAQLNAIAQNTLRSADAAEHIDYLFNSVINGTKKIRIN